MAAFVVAAIIVVGAVGVLRSRTGVQEPTGGIARVSSASVEDARDSVAADEPVTDTQLNGTGAAPLTARPYTTARTLGLATSRLTVRAKAGRKSVPDARVRVLVSGKPVGDPEAATTNARGRAVFVVPADNVVTVEVTGGWTTTTVECQVRTAPPGEFKTRVVDLGELPPQYSVTLEVRSIPSGAPVASASVTSFATVRQRLGKRQSRGVTDAAGRVTLPWPGASSYIVDAPGHSSAYLKDTGSHDSAVRDVPLYADGRLFGRLAIREPEEGMSIRFGRPYSGDVRDLPSVSVRPDREGVAVVHGSRGPEDAERIDDNGQWEINEIAFCDQLSARTGVSVYAVTDGNWRLVASDVTVRPGESVLVADIFENAPPLSLRLRYATDDAVFPEVEVSLSPAGSEEYELWAEARVEVVNGQSMIELDQLPTGSWNLHMAVPGNWEPGPLIATFQHVGGDLHELPVEGLVPLRGSVYRADGSDCRTASLTLVGSDWTREDDTGRYGSFDFSPVRKGEAFTLWVHDWGGDEVEEVRGLLGISYGPSYRQSSFPDDVPVSARKFEIVATGVRVTVRL